MKNKRVLAALLIAAMTVGLTACGGSSDSNGSAAGTETGSTKADGDYEQVTYAYSTFNNIPTEEGNQVGIGKDNGNGGLSKIGRAHV